MGGDRELGKGSGLDQALIASNLEIVTRLGLELLRLGRLLDGVGVDGRQLVDAGIEVGDVQEARLGEPDVDEGRLHPGKHAQHLALVDVAGDATIARTLDVNLGERAVLDQRDSRLLGVWR